MAQSTQIDHRYLRRTEISRDGWRERALQYQTRIRSSRISLRDLTRSRDKWQLKAINAQNELKAKKAEIKRLKQTISNLRTTDRTNPDRSEVTEIVDIVKTTNCDSQEIITAIPDRYLYPIFIIQLAIQQRIFCFTSWQGVAKTFQIWSQFFQLPTPNYNTIKQWFLKFGLFELQQPKEYRNDWIFIIDTTWGQGQKKCFLIIGISYEQWHNKIENNYSNLKHQDITVLSLDVLNVSNGQIISEKISNLATQVGQPLQIISDHGPDIKKGIELYIESEVLNPEI